MKEITFLISGISLGLVAGISPGPLLALVISETLKFNKKAGIRVACVPIITDFPIVFFSIYFLWKIGNYNQILGIISFIGAVFLVYLAWESLKNTNFQINQSRSGQNKPFSMQKGIIANFLSPHPYLFWITVGGPIIFKSYKIFGF